MTKKEIDLISSRAKGIKGKIYYDELGNKYIGLVNGRIVKDTTSNITTATVTQLAKQVANSVTGTVTSVNTPIALDDLTDVTLTSPTSNEYLVYNGTDWVNQAAPAGTGTVTSVGLSAGTGISVGGTNPVTTSGTITVTNTAPDQVVSLATTGTGLAVTGTYPNFTLQNTLPDQTVALTAGTGINVTGTYPSFTITNSSPGGSGTVTSISTSAPITGGTITTTGTIGITQASTSTDGYLSSADWNTFNNKVSTNNAIAYAIALG